MRPDKERKTVEKVCKALVQARLDQSLSQQRLAEMAGLSRTGLRHIEAGTSNPTLHSLLKIAKALEVDLATLLSPDAFRSGI